MAEKPKLTLRELQALEFYPPSLASEYLFRVRGIVLAPDSLRSIRRRKRSEITSAKIKLVNNTLWTRDELEKIQATKRTERVEPERDDEMDQGGPSSVPLTTRYSCERALVPA
jgi:hypothetical protein